MFAVVPVCVADATPVLCKIVALLLNVVQSALDKAPRFDALAVGIFNVIEPLVVIGEPLIFTSVPLVPALKPPM